MKRPLYIFSNGVLKREGHTLVLRNENTRRVIPVETVSELNLFGEIQLNKRLLTFLTQHQILVHVYNYYGYYAGTYYPRTALNSGLILLKQAEHYLDASLRMDLARAFVRGAIRNMLYVLRRYQSQGIDLSAHIDTLSAPLEAIAHAETPAQLMAHEGHAREIYYDAFDAIIQDPAFAFGKRTRKPPRNPINALISFGNMLLYRTCLSEIYRTHLDPRIGYLHETNQRSFTLNLDLAEVFKPILVDRTIFRLINRRQITPRHFDERLGGFFLNTQGSQRFVQAFEEALNRTLHHKRLRRQVSYRRLIRLECYKLYRHLLDGEPYEPFILTR